MLPYDIQLTLRDRAILRTLVECRLATYQHLADLHFEGRLEAAKKRAIKLIASGYLTQRPRRVSEPVILHLTGKALKQILSEGLMERYPRLAREDINRRATVSDATVQHELSVMDFRCAVTTALQTRPTYRTTEFSTWPLLHSFHAQTASDTVRTLFRPDGYLGIAESGEDHQNRAHAFFIELDRGTENLATLLNRCLGYRQFFLSGGYAKWHGAPRNQFQRYPFRVLIVVPNEERRNNLAQRLLELSPPILGMVWIAVKEAAMTNPFGAIWITPADYRAAVEGTPFAIQHETQTSWYRRQVYREAIVRQRIGGRSLLNE